MSDEVSSTAKQTFPSREALHPSPVGSVRLSASEFLELLAQRGVQFVDRETALKALDDVEVARLLRLTGAPSSGSSARPFEKPAKSHAELLELLIERGLVIEDRNRALSALRQIGFYRLSAYMLPFQRGDRSADHHRFIEGSRFESILQIYDFDARLREITFRAISEIEVRFAAEISDSLSLPHGGHWFLKAELFKSQEAHRGRLDELLKAAGPQSRKTIAVEHYHQKYGSPLLPPSWVTLGAIEFGVLSRLFSELKRQARKPIADAYGLDGRTLSSWLESVSVLRNFCAHHQRIWNRHFSKKPKPSMQFPEDIPANAVTYYAQACIVHLLSRYNRRPDTFRQELGALLGAANSPKDVLLGFPSNWRERPLWSADQQVPIPVDAVLPGPRGS